MKVPESLTDPELKAVWEAARLRLERAGVDNRGRIRLPDLAPRSRHVLASLIDRRLASTLDLTDLERGLTRVGVGGDLASALAALGEPVSPEPARRRAARAEARVARQHARKLAGDWPEPWSERWIDETIRAGLLAGLDNDQAAKLVENVRAVLDALALSDGPLLSRTDLAATLLGSSHALDDGTRLGAAATRALRHRVEDLDGADVWEQAGAHPDLVSGPVLTWALPVRPGSALEPLAAAAARLAVPLHLTQLTLRRHPVEPPPGRTVLVVENPRVVEAAAQRGHPGAVVCANGNPSGAVRLALDQLLTGGAELFYHGDFDPAGLAICRRMQRLGLRPWRMDAPDYRAAVEAAVAAGVDLPAAEQQAGPTPWDPELKSRFNDTRAIVHQERLLDLLLET